MDVNETKLTCPYCGAGYQARDTACPNCGKALSPTGYSPYGEGEAMEQQAAPLPEEIAAQSTRTLAGTTGRPLASGSQQTQARRYYLPIAAVFALFVIWFVASNSQLRSVVVIGEAPIPTLPPLPMIIADTPTPVYQSDPNAGKVKVSYVRVLGTSAGALVANIYDLGTGAELSVTT